jgi:hypothetical protein
VLTLSIGEQIHGASVTAATGFVNAWSHGHNLELCILGGVGAGGVALLNWNPK